MIDKNQELIEKLEAEAASHDWKMATALREKQAEEWFHHDRAAKQIRVILKRLIEANGKQLLLPIPLPAPRELKPNEWFRSKR